MAARKINDSAKLQNFARYVTSDAAQQNAALTRELDERWARMVDETELALYRQAYEKIQRARAELTRATNEAISREKLSCKRQLSARRSEITEEVMAAVRGEVTAFVKSEAYYPWLLRTAQLAAGARSEGNVVLYLNETDAAYVQRLRADTGCRVELLDAAHDVVGGVKAVNTDTHTAVNKTLAAMLERQREEFLKISGLGI